MVRFAYQSKVVPAKEKSYKDHGGNDQAGKTAGYSKCYILMTSLCPLLVSSEH